MPIFKNVNKFDFIYVSKKQLKGIVRIVYIERKNLFNLYYISYFHIFNNAV